MSSSALTKKERLFVDEYLLDLNGAQAAIRAGYSTKGADACAGRLLGRVRVRQAVDEALKARAGRVQVNADEVLRELRRIALADPRQAFDGAGKLKPIHEIPPEVARGISGIEVEELFEGRGGERVQVGTVRKVKFWDKVRSLELLAKHLGLLVEKHDHTHRITLEELVTGDSEGAPR